MSEHPVYDAKYGQPIYKDGCGIFGIVRKKDAPKVSNLKTLDGISCISYRGSDLGAGFALFDPSISAGPNVHRLKAFVRNKEVADDLTDRLTATLSSPRNVQVMEPGKAEGKARFEVWEGTVDSSDTRTLEKTIDGINGVLLSSGKIDGRIFSYGSYLDVFKDVGYPMDVAREYGLD
ncbi:MAG TPA: hypothetical protein VLY65_01770, partial [Nitrososphaerales archaeon]|nr:hypothetical protein [Nitrososphaerales archaeon]